MTEVKKGKTYTDHRGNEIPSSFIHKIDRQKHAAAERLMKKAKKLSEQLIKFKAEVIAECDALYQQSLEENRIKPRENAKGGYSIKTIDKAQTIQVSVSERISFDDNIDLAQELIKQYVGEVTADTGNDIKILVNQAFKTRSGQLDTKRVLELLKLEIKNEKWLRAMELIKKSINVEGSKRYIQFWEKDAEGKDVNIKMDFASI